LVEGAAMETDSTSGVIATIIAWLPFVIYVGTWIWGVAVFKRYARSQQIAGADNSAAIRELVESNREITTVLRELKDDLRQGRS
jgi:L-lactate permease